MDHPIAGGKTLQRALTGLLPDLQKWFFYDHLARQHIRNRVIEVVFMQEKKLQRVPLAQRYCIPASGFVCPEIGFGYV